MNDDNPEKHLWIAKGTGRECSKPSCIADEDLDQEEDDPKKASEAQLEHTGRPQNGEDHDLALLRVPLCEQDPSLKGRTRFFIEVAMEHGPRLAALVFLVAIYTDGKHRKGRRGRKNAWHQKATWFGEQIGVSSRQIKRLLRQAVDAGLLDYERTGRGLLVWCVGQRAWRLMDKYNKGRYVLGHYDVELAKGLGINAATILDLLERPAARNYDQALAHLTRAATDLGLDPRRLSALLRDAGHPEPQNEDQKRREREYRRLDYKGVHHRFPWISEGEADYELRRLYRLGLINRRPLDQLTAGQRGTRWIYYSQKCLQKVVA